MKFIDLILENEVFFNLLSEQGRLDVLKSKFVDSKLMNQITFDRIVDADPTPNKTYSQWLLNQYVKEVVKPYEKNKADNQSSRLSNRAKQIFLEDLDGIGEGLAIFDRFKRKFTEKDINKYSVSSFKKAALDVADTLSDDEKQGGEHRFSADEKKFPEYKIGEVNGFTVWKLPQGDNDAEEAACELGKNTSWCTKDGAFKRYNRYDPLYIFIGKGTKYQFHFHDNQFKNRVDGDMQDGELKDSFLKFLEDYEGRVAGKRDISSYKIGDYNTPQGKFPIFKVGRDKYYTSINGEEIFYNPDDGLLKTKNGKTVSSSGVIFTHPYMDFLKEIYRRLKETGDTKGFRGIYRLLLDLDVPQKGPREWWTIPGSLSLEDSELTKLPEGLHIKGDLNLDGSKIKELPKRIKVDGEITGLDKSKAA